MSQHSRFDASKSVTALSRRIFRSDSKSRLILHMAPYVDGFSLEQHKYGPFGPTRAKVEELAAASRAANAGEPDNGSGVSERAR